MDSLYILTTIGRNDMVAIMEVSSHEKPLEGERTLSFDCVKRNLDSGRFKDATKFASNSYGKIYALAEDLDYLQKCKQ